MQIIMKTDATDGYTFCVPVFTPIIAESPEAAYVHWCNLRDSAFKEKGNYAHFIFAGIDFYYGDDEPDFITNEQFFKDAVEI